MTSDFKHLVTCLLIIWISFLGNAYSSLLYIFKFHFCLLMILRISGICLAHRYCKHLLQEEDGDFINSNEARLSFLTFKVGTFCPPLGKSSLTQHHKDLLLFSPRSLTGFHILFYDQSLISSCEW